MGLQNAVGQSTMTDEQAEPDSGVARLSGQSYLSITDLSPSIPTSSPQSIKAIVTLIWPYSSSSNALTVLLAEPDFRLRRNRGQVRVQFIGASAQAVARAHIASGDEVHLALEGVQWVQREHAVNTPGKAIDCEARFKDKLMLQVYQPLQARP